MMLRKYGIAIELELASPTERDREIGDELARHFEHYAASAPNVKAVVGLVFDPGHHLKNPEGLRADRSSDTAWAVPARTVVIPR
jgi:hypothetical protein